MAPKTTVIGCDLGGTKCSVARFDSSTWELLAYEKKPTVAGRGFDKVLADLEAMVEELRMEDTVAMGVGIPGLVRHEDGHLLRAPNIPGAEDIALQSILQKRLDLPVIVENDARCFTFSEAMTGAGKGHDIVVGVAIGTGVGGGIVIDGNIHRGHSGFAGEFGHMLLRPGEPPFETKDKRGDTEQFFSGTAMGKRCEDAKTPEDYLKKGGSCSFMQPHIFREIGWMIVNLTYALDPSIVILGGSTGRALKPHLKEINKEVKQWLLPGTPAPKVAIAQIEHPGTMGAAMLAAKLTKDN